MATYISTNDRLSPLRGHFKMRVLDKEGTVIDTYEDHNMIVNLARTAMSKLVSEGSAEKVITKFAVGIGTETATPTDTGLTEMYSNAILEHTFPEEGSVRFSWRLGYDESNDRNITEFGLLCDDNTLFSRKVRSGIFKDSDLAFEGEWTIIF